MVIKRSEQSSSVDIVEVLEIIRNTPVKNSEKEQTTEPDESFDEIFYHDAEIIDSEETDNICCDVVIVISTDTVANFYPAILGEYRKTNLGTTLPIYAKGSTPVQYLSQPQSDGEVLGYSWGVSPAPEAKWGYIRSSKSAPCPTMAGQWKVFHKGTNRWGVDTTLKVVCKEK